jgi:hypothetical protein
MTAEHRTFSRALHLSQNMPLNLLAFQPGLKPVKLSPLAFERVYDNSCLEKMG